MHANFCPHSVKKVIPITQPCLDHPCECPLSPIRNFDDTRAPIFARDHDLNEKTPRKCMTRDENSFTEYI